MTIKMLKNAMFIGGSLQPAGTIMDVGDLEGRNLIDPPAFTDPLPDLPPVDVVVDEDETDEIVEEGVTRTKTADELPALSGKNKAELLVIAKDEGVTVEDGATNAEIVEAIEAKRAN